MGVFWGFLGGVEASKVSLLGIHESAPALKREGFVGVHCGEMRVYESSGNYLGQAAFAVVVAFVPGYAMGWAYASPRVCASSSPAPDFCPGGCPGDCAA